MAFLSAKHQGRTFYLKMFSHERPCLFRQIYLELKTAENVRHIQYRAISHYWHSAYTKQKEWDLLRFTAEKIHILSWELCVNFGPLIYDCSRLNIC